MKRITFLLFVLVLFFFFSVPVPCIQAEEFGDEAIVQDIPVEMMEETVQDGTVLGVIDEVYAAGAGLQMIPTSVTEDAGVPFDVTIALDAGTENVRAMDLALMYDPDKLEIIDVQKGDATGAFVELAKSIDPAKGIVLFSLGAPLEGSTILSKGAVAVVKLQAKGGGSATLSFDRGLTVVAVQGQEESILGDVGNAEITIKGGSVPSALPTLSTLPVVPILAVGVGVLAVGGFLMWKQKQRKPATDVKNPVPTPEVPVGK